MVQSRLNNVFSNNFELIEINLIHIKRFKNAKKDSLKQYLILVMKDFTIKI